MATLTLANPLQSTSHQIGLFSVLASSCAINILSLAMPIATLQIYDRVLQWRNESTLELLLIGVIIALIVETLLRIIRSYVICQRGAIYVHGMSCAAFNRQVDARTLAGENQTVAAELSGLSAIKGMKDFNSGYSKIVVVDLLFLPLFIAVIAYVSHSLVLVPVFLLCAFGLVIALSGLRVRRQLEISKTQDDERNNFIIETLLSSQFVKSHSLEKLLQRRFERLHTLSCTTGYWLSRSITESAVFSASLGHAVTAATVAAGTYLVVNDQITIGALIAAVQLSSRLMQPVHQGVILWLRYHGHESARERVARLFEAPTSNENADRGFLHNDGRIDVEQVSFRLSPKSPLLFDGITFSLDRGQSALIDGPTGTGKTILLKMIAGIYAPNAGRVLINGTDASLVSSTEIARHVAYLAPRSGLLRGTIRDNITRFNQVPVTQALALARYIGLKEDFDRLPMGIDTMVGGEDDARLSPGLIQMTSLLRVLSSKPRIILFDDADNGVDTSYYNRLFSLLGKIKPNVAMLIVSRDMNIRQLADRRFILSEGRLTETDRDMSRTNLRFLGV